MRALYLNVDPIIHLKKWLPNFKKIAFTKLNVTFNNGKEVPCTALDTFMIESI